MQKNVGSDKNTYETRKNCEKTNVKWRRFSKAINLYKYCVKKLGNIWVKRGLSNLLSGKFFFPAPYLY